MRTRSAPQSRPAPRVRLQRPAQIVAALPYLLGFHPRESLVVIGLRGQPRTVCLTVRTDLPSVDGVDGGAAADLLAAHLEHAGATAAVALVVSEQEPHVGQPVVTAFERATAARDVTVSDALWVRDGRWASYRCRDASCCPPAGSPVDPQAASELAAASVLMGEVVHGSREDLERSLRPVDGPERASLDRTFEWLSRQLLGELTRRGWEPVAEESLALLGDAVTRRVAAGGDLTPAEVARLAFALADVGVRDRALCWTDGAVAGAAESLWVELTRRATPPYDAAPATLLAVHAYLRGNGAYARIALERALASDPDYSLARLLADGLDRGVPPRALRVAITASRAA